MPSGGVDSHLSDLLTHAPELQQSPGLSVGLAQGLFAAGTPVDPAQLAQLSSLALQGQGITQANSDIGQTLNAPEQKQHEDGGGVLGHISGFFRHDIVHPLGVAGHAVVHDVVAPVGQVLNAGLNEVTHTYRYIHDVWERHGVLAALGELAIIGTAAAAGSLLGPIGAVLAAEVAGDLSARLGYSDSWRATGNGEAYLDKQGFKVSPGRDLARLIGYITPMNVGHDKQGNVTGAHAGLISGLGDATFDISLDPTLKLGSLVRIKRAAAAMPQTAESWKSIEGGEELGRRPMVDTANIRPNNVQVIYRNNPAVADAFNRIADMKTKDVLASYPALRPMAAALGQAKTGQEVADSFEMALTARNYDYPHYGLPRTSLTRRSLGKVGVNAPSFAQVGHAIQSGLVASEDSSRIRKILATHKVAEDPNNPGRELLSSTIDGMPLIVPSGPVGHVINGFTSYAPFAFNSNTLKLSGVRGNPDDPEFMRGLYSVLRYSQNATTSKAILARFAEAKDTAEKVAVVSNAYRDALRASGLPDTNPYAASIIGDLNFLQKQALGAKYATDTAGRPIRMVDEEGNVLTRGIFVNQTGEIAFPDFNEWTRVIRESRGGLWSAVGKGDDFLNRAITTRLFKRLVLLSLGFGLRVSAGELIPASLAHGGRNILGAGIAAASAKVAPSFKELIETVPRDAESESPFIGIRATTPGMRHIGTISAIHPDVAEATLRFGEGEEARVPFNRLTVFHHDITDDEVAAQLREYGAEFTRDELPHYRAAMGKALYGVSKALVDSDYREVALMNLAGGGDGHMVAPGLSSSHDLPRGFEGINQTTRKAALSANINLPKKSALGRKFTLWRPDEETQPLFWSSAIKEAADDPGVRAMARAYADTLRISEGHDYEAIAEQIRGGGVTYDPRTKTFKNEGFAFASHPKHESAIALDEFEPGHVRQFMEAKAAHMAQEPNHLGAWVEDGKAYFDVSHVTSSEAEAQQLASERGEKAYADLAAFDRGEDGTRPLDYASDKARLRRRHNFNTRQPISDGSVQFGPVVQADGLATRGSAKAGAGEAGEGAAAGAPDADLVRRVGGQHQVAADEAAHKADRVWFESDHPEAVHARQTMAGHIIDPEQYSAVRVEALKGLIYGQNGRVNLDVLDAIARGESPGIAELADKEIGHRPLAVKGRELTPIVELGTMDRVIAAGWKPIHEIINTLSRAPIWTALVTDEYKFFKPWMNAGLMTKAEAHSIAQVRALNRMLPLIHNTMLRSKFSLVARNVVPFYFAQEQAYKRYGRAMLHNPKAFREAQLLMHSLHATGAIQQDDQGNSYVVYPGAGHMPTLMTLGLSHLGINVLGGVPTTVAGNTISLRTVVPEMVGPGVGPVVAVPLKSLASFFPTTDPFVRDIMGIGGSAAANSKLKDQFIPNAFIRRVWDSLNTSDKNQAFASTVSMNAAWAAHKALPLWQQAEAIDPRAMDMSIARSQLDPRAAKLLRRADRYLPLPSADPHDRQVAMDRFRNAAHVQLMFKALFGVMAPLAPVMQVGDVKLRADLQASMAKYGVTAGLQRFMDKNPDATPDTVFLSDNSATGINPPATSAALHFIEQNRGWVNNNQLAAAYLLPQTPGKFDSLAYDQELALHLRQRRTPDQFLDAVYTAIGNDEFFASLKSYQDQKAQLLADGDTDGAKQLGQTWNSYFQSLASRNPVWYANEFSITKDANAIHAYQQLVRAANDPHTPDTPQLPLARELISDYESYQQQLALARAGTGTYSETQLKAQWKDYIDQYVSEHPEARAMAYGVFRRLGNV